MRVGSRLTSLTVRALAESMDVHTMIVVARRLIHNYNLFKRTGFPTNISIPNKDAARQIVSDMKARELFLDLVRLLIEIRDRGLKGRRYRIPYLRDIMIEINNAGMVYNKESSLFYEDHLLRKTKNWGILRNHGEYIITFMRLDIVGSSSLLRNNNSEAVKRTYADLRSIVKKVVENRHGRIWHWEGDGVLVAFYLTNRDNNAALSAMEIIHELYIYNILGSRLDEPLKVRIAVDSGPCTFRHNFDDIKSDTIKSIESIESKSTRPNCVTFSSNVYMYLDHLITEQLKQIEGEVNPPYYCYELKWEC